MEEGLPLFSTEGMPNISFDSMKQTMEASMPKKILGMGYQQRFQVNPFLSIARRTGRSKLPAITIPLTLFYHFPFFFTFVG